MKKIILGFIAIITMVSCNTVKEYAIRIDDDYVVKEQITPYGYTYYSTAVTDIYGDVTYKVNVNGRWYIINKGMSNKYRIGDNMNKNDFNSIK